MAAGGIRFVVGTEEIVAGGYPYTAGDYFLSAHDETTTVCHLSRCAATASSPNPPSASGKPAGQGGFGDEAVAAQRLEWQAGGIRFVVGTEEIVAGRVWVASGDYFLSAH